MTNAAAYLRSSKDRHDLSIDAQRRALHEHARAQGLAIVAEFADAVESGKDDDRPGFQAILTALKNRDRGWSVVLALDTSRIARRRHLALIFEHEAEKAGVAVQYRSVPDTDPITGMLLRSILQAMDEWHSLTSRAKGLAGMAEAVRQGYRAGGSAPIGYRLEQVHTGTIREGQPVIRSRLVPADDSQAVAAYLRARAAGKPRGLASQVSGITGSLNDLEWRALTYAGHTVWNQHQERKGGSYIGGSKHRPREEWHITRDTHEALITEAEAEAILAQLAEKSGRRNRATDRVYLLSGLLVAPDGTAWSGGSTRGDNYYRLGMGKRVSARLIERAVLDAIVADLQAPEVAEQIAERMRALSRPQGKPVDLSKLRGRIKAIDTKSARLVDLIADDPDAAPAYRRAVAQMEQERIAIEGEIAEAERVRQTAEVVSAWTAADVKRMLAALAESIAADLEDGKTRDLRGALSDLVERIEYDPETRQAVIRYRLTGVMMASPRGSIVAPVEWERSVSVPSRAAA